MERSLCYINRIPVTIGYADVCSATGTTDRPKWIGFTRALLVRLYNILYLKCNIYDGPLAHSH